MADPEQLLPSCVGFEPHAAAHFVAASEQFASMMHWTHAALTASHICWVQVSPHALHLLMKPEQFFADDGGGLGGGLLLF